MTKPPLRILIFVCASMLSACTPKYAVVTPQLHAQMMADLKDGKPVLTCQFGCHWSWLSNFPRMIALHNARQWEPLAELVMQVGHEKDIAYYFLGRSAEGLGYREAALKYYRRGSDLFADATSLHHCRSLENGCAGVDLAAVLPARVAAVSAPNMSPDAADSASMGAGAIPSKGANGISKDATPITDQILNNLSVKLPYNGPEETVDITFRNGSYVEKAPLGKTGEPEYPDTTADIVERAFGDLNGDRVTDAAILCTFYPGGNAVFYSVLAVIAAPGKPLVTAAEDLGPKIDFKSLAIKSGRIIVKAILHGPNDSMCCPTEKANLIYGVRNGALVDFKQRSAK